MVTTRPIAPERKRRFGRGGTARYLVLFGNDKRRAPDRDLRTIDWVDELDWLYRVLEDNRSNR